MCRSFKLYLLRRLNEVVEDLIGAEVCLGKYLTEQYLDPLVCLAHAREASHGLVESTENFHWRLLGVLPLT